ncbi:MAG TPA: DUF3426 domain-containing protein [Caulobacteraceae bacterium]|jgi:predicted Zn finger-like uncharacterized protein
MILTCPECATRYFVDDVVAGAGRTVRCTNCGHAWKAEAPLELRVSAEEGALAHAPSPEPKPLRGEDLPKAYRARVEERRRVREAAATGAVWAGGAAALAVVVAAIVIFRADVVRVWPKSASAYAAAGLPVNRVGLTIEQVQAQPALQDGRTALVVSGVLRNIRPEPVRSPPLKVTLLDKEGARLKQTVARAADAPAPPGSTRPFTLTLLEPPAAATDVEVTFALDAPTAKHPKAERRSTETATPPKLRQASESPAPAAPAQPLPADSPYALEAHGG